VKMPPPLTAYILAVLRGITRAEAGKLARKLGVRLDWAQWYWEVMG